MAQYINEQPTPGATRTYIKHVTKADFASFEDGLVHAVCSTFALAQAVEWAGRLFVLDIKAQDEEGIGTYLSMKHESPAFEGEAVEIVATLQSLKRNEVLCSFEAKVGERLVATGETGQKIFKKDKLASIMAQYKV